LIPRTNQVPLVRNLIAQMLIRISIAYPSNKFLGYRFRLLLNQLMIDDGVLVQVYSTVLVGVLIFLTLERRFEGEEGDNKAKNMMKKITKQRRYLLYLMADREHVKQEKDYNRDSTIVKQDYYDNRIKKIDKDLEQEQAKMKTLQSEFGKMSEEYSQEIQEYIDKTTQEGIITLTMIVFLVTSIISLLIGSIFDRPHIPDILTPLARIASFVLFSIAIVLLVSRVYLHSK
jgi:hypothetical protein